MEKSKILELLIYGLRIGSIITMVIGAVAMFFSKVFFLTFSFDFRDRTLNS